LRIRGASRNAALIAVFTALVLATDYAMVPLVNVKLMDTLVFVAALAFGFRVGASVAGLSWLVYGTFSPWGASSGPWIVLLMLSEMIYAALGLAAARFSGWKSWRAVEKSAAFGFLGFFGALAYDLNTIVTPALLSGIPLVTSVFSLVPAVPFMAAHEVSDFVFFSTVGPVLYATVVRVARSKFAAGQLAAVPR
jgi:hypothetical protein